MSRDIVKKDINYLSGDFASFRQNLINFSKIYFPNTYNDFNESDPGMMYIEQASVVGDVLTYYLNTQLREMIFSYAEERRNIINISQSPLGYKPPTSITSVVDMDIFQLIPASGSDAVPDYRYTMRLNSGMLISSTISPNLIFTIRDDVDFGVSSSLDQTDISVYQIDSSTNLPTYYLLKKTRKAYSGNKKTETFTFGSPEKFPSVVLSENNIIEILNVEDADGNVYTEVPHLAQELVFEEVPNTAQYDKYLSAFRPSVPYLLRYKKVPKRFATKVTADNRLEVQFGAGISDIDDEIIIPNPDNIGSSLPEGITVLEQPLDPSNFLYTKTYGVAPSNTTLDIEYTYGGGLASNVPAGDLVELSRVTSTFNSTGLDTGLMNQIRASIACINQNPATGGRGRLTTNEIKENALSFFSSQNRCVTDEDYAVRIKALPAKFGYVSKVFVTSESRFDLKRNFVEYGERSALNIYCLTYDSNGYLTVINDAIKQNLVTYLKKYKMLTDGINIRDGYIINIGLNFEILVVPSQKEPETVLLNCINKMKSFFDIQYWDFNEPIIIADIYRELNNVDGVQSVTNVDIVNLYSVEDGYSGNIYDIPSATFNNVLYPSLDPSVFEIKYLNQDIKGKVSTI